MDSSDYVVVWGERMESTTGFKFIYTIETQRLQDVALARLTETLFLVFWQVTCCFGAPPYHLHDP